MAKTYPPDYYQPGYPVLSFLYALYADSTFSHIEYTSWALARNEGYTYTRFLDKYQPFPATSEQVIVDAVPNNPATDGYYMPLPPQAQIGVDDIFAEMDRDPQLPQRPPGDRTPAQLGADRPVLRILAVLYLNETADPPQDVSAAIANLNASPSLTVSLNALVINATQLGKKPAGLTATQKKDIGDELVKEFCTPPPVW